MALVFTLVAQSCTGRTGPWDGMLVLEVGPVLSMIAIGGAAGEIGYPVLGPAAEPGGTVGIVSPALPDPVTIIVSAMIGGGGDFGDLAVTADDILDGIDDPHRPIALAAAFSLPRSGTTTMVLAGAEPGYTLRVHPGNRNVVELTAGGTHLLNAVIERTSCKPGEVGERARELVSGIDG